MEDMNWKRNVNLLFDKVYLLKIRLYSLFLRIRFKKVGSKFRIAPTANVKGGQYISIGNNAVLMRGVRIQAYDKYREKKYNPSIEIGDYFNCGEDVHIGAINHICIGNNVLLGSRIYITDHQHGNYSTEERNIEPLKRTLFSSGKVIIEDNVFIGDGAVIFPNVTIGKGAVVGANSVVTHDVPQYAIVAGVPARVLRTV